MHHSHTPALAAPGGSHEAVHEADLTSRENQPQDCADRHIADLLHVLPEEPLLALHREQTPVSWHRKLLTANWTAGTCPLDAATRLGLLQHDANDQPNERQKLNEPHAEQRNLHEQVTLYISVYTCRHSL